MTGKLTLRKRTKKGHGRKWLPDILLAFLYCHRLWKSALNIKDNDGPGLLACHFRQLQKIITRDKPINTLPAEK